MSEARITARQWVLSLFTQHPQLDGGLLVGRRMRRRIGVAASQNIDWVFGGIHWHVKLFVMYTICHNHPHCNWPRREVNCARLPLWMPRSFASSGETSTNVSGVFFLMPGLR
jgi:hypothetical protein